VKGLQDEIDRARDRVAAARGRLMHGLYGRRPQRHEAELDASQWWDAARLEAWQAERITELCAHAWRQVPWTRRRLERAGWAPGRPMDDATWARLPLLTKEDMRTWGPELRASHGRAVVGTTSGSTGTPVKVWHDDGFWSYMFAVQRRAFGWYGVEPNSPTFYFGGAPHDLKGRLRRRAIDLAIDRRCVPAYDMGDDALDRVLDTLEAWRPRIVSGYTSALFALARRAEVSGRDLSGLGVRMVMPKSELTRDVHTEAFTRVFGAPVMTEYGCVEIGAMAYTCPHGRIHPSHDHVRMEVIDDAGAPAVEGEVGHVVFTPLFARGMPLLRYKLGDMVAVARGRCSCGRQPGAPLILEIAGRSFDRMIDLDGKRWNGLLLYYTFKEVFDPRVFREFQGVQSEPGRLRLVIAPGPAFTPEHAERFAAKLRAKMGDRMEVGWETVEVLQREASAKLKYFRSELDPALLEA
jgi:phenylacetate-CoA ligase